MVAFRLTQSALLAAFFTFANAAAPYNTFDGEGFPACNAVASVVYPKSVAEAATIVKNAAAAGTPVRASGGGHSWYNTMCSDDPNTIILKTEYLNGISNFDLAGGSVVIEGGVTFLQLANWLHQRGAAIGYTLVNWNITIGGAIAMGAHRSSLREDSMVAAAALSLDIINGNGDIVHIEKDGSDTWLAATTSLGLLGVIARIKFQIFPDFKVYANQKTLDESAVLNGDIGALISPYATANLWWWPGQKKFHQRFYDVISINDPGDSLQNTFGLSSFEASVASTLLNGGVTLPSNNAIAEWTFFQAWSFPNFRDQSTQLPIILWPTTGWAYDVLIGGLYPDQKTEWEYGLHGKTLELAVPMPYANALLKRVRRHFDESAAAGKTMYSTYRSGINIKFGKPFTDFLGQVTPTSNADWSKGAIMFDFPRFVTADGKCYNEQFYLDLAKIIVDEFPARPHWTKNTREVFTNAVKNLDADHLKRFAAVRARFDPKKTFKSVVGQIIGVV